MMRYTVDYGTRRSLYGPRNGFAAFRSFNDALRFASITAQAEPGISFSVYEDGNLIETFKTKENPT